ncbi:MAG TPA: cytochrome c [Balneolaceae bacterium]|nr:cytochrome c [Balneolaceae bacterium]
MLKIDFLLLLMPFFILIGCGNSENERSKPEIVDDSFKNNRWYTESQYKMGRVVFSENCARCHGTKGQGLVENWKKPNPDGSFPPPPLNGTAHTWHHPMEILVQTINIGGAPYGGNMPAFREVLSEEEKIAVIAYIQNLWDQKTYDRWTNMNAKF